MNFLSLFVLIPVLMLCGLFLAGNMKQIRWVCATGASLLLILSTVLTFMYLGERSAGNTEAMLFTANSVWYAPLNIHYSVGVDGIVFCYCIHGHIYFLENGSAAQRILHVVLLAEHRCFRLLYFNRFVHHVHVLRNRLDSDVPAYWRMGYG